MSDDNPRMQRESKTIEAMTTIYCHRQDQHEGGLCPECGELLDHPQGRLEKCPFQLNKPACARCPVHCYKPSMREKIRAIVRYAGPPIIHRRPLLAILHLIDGFRKDSSGRKGRERL